MYHQSDFQTNEMIYHSLHADAMNVIKPFLWVTSNIPVRKMLTKLSRPQLKDSLTTRDTLETLENLINAFGKSGVCEDDDHVSDFGDVRLYKIEHDEPGIMEKMGKKLLGANPKRWFVINASLGNAETVCSQRYQLFATSDCSIVLDLETAKVVVSYIPILDQYPGCHISFNGKLVALKDDNSIIANNDVTLNAETMEVKPTCTDTSLSLYSRSISVPRDQLQTQIEELIRPFGRDPTSNLLSIIEAVSTVDSLNIELQLREAIEYRGNAWQAKTIALVLAESPATISLLHKTLSIDQVIFSQSEIISAATDNERVKWELDTKKVVLTGNGKLDNAIGILDHLDAEKTSEAIFSFLRDAIGTYDTTFTATADNRVGSIVLLVDPERDVNVNFHGRFQSSRISIPTLNILVQATQSSIHAAYHFVHPLATGVFITLGEYRLSFRQSRIDSYQSVELKSQFKIKEKVLDFLAKMEVSPVDPSETDLQTLQNMNIVTKSVVLDLSSLRMTIKGSVSDISDRSKTSSDQNAELNLQLSHTSPMMTGVFNGLGLQVTVATKNAIPSENDQTSTLC